MNRMGSFPDTGGRYRSHRTLRPICVERRGRPGANLLPTRYRNLGAGFGDDLVFGGPGDDIIRGDGERDTIRGGPGNDELYGGSHGDTVLGEDGNDMLWGDYGYGRAPTGDDESGNDVLDGGPGHDRLDGEGGTDWCRSSADVERSSGCERTSADQEDAAAVPSRVTK